jgi:hypothetical protein
MGGMSTGSNSLNQSMGHSSAGSHTDKGKKNNLQLLLIQLPWISIRL